LDGSDEMSPRVSDSKQATHANKLIVSIGYASNNRFILKHEKLIIIFD
jgi:hypothetical protein